MTQLISADELFNDIVSSKVTNEEKLRCVNELKTHVKKDFVDLKQVARYMEALSFGVESDNPNLAYASFSVISHLIKRVSMQDTSGECLKKQSYLALPIIIKKLGDIKGSTRSSAKKALEAYWFSAPQEVEEAINDMALTHKDRQVTYEALLWLDNLITTVNPNFKLNRFLDNIAQILKEEKIDENDELFKTIKHLLTDYYNLKQNKLYKFDLTKVIESNEVDMELRNALYDAIGINSDYLIKGEKTEDNSTDPNFVTAGKTKVTIHNFDSKIRHTTATTSHMPSKPRSRTNFQNYVKPSSTAGANIRKQTTSFPEKSKEKFSRSSRSSPTPADDHVGVERSSSHVSIVKSVEKIVSKDFTYDIDASIPAVNITEVSDLNHYASEFLPLFSDKETEFNWNPREKSIIHIRSLLRGNSPKDFSEEFLMFLKEVSEGINKAITSLRTTLCAHGCFLIKECSIIMKECFDPLIDLFIPTLIKLCSSTKHITSSNANVALSAIFINSSFSIKLMQRIQSASIEKNVQPRSYSGTWLHIFIVRFHDNPAFVSHNGSNTGIEISSKVLQKLLADPNPTVRQTAKTTYWCFWEMFPSEAESLLSRLEVNVVKGIKRSKPKNIPDSDQPASLNVLNSKKSRPSIKETIIARNRELKKQRDSSNYSRPASRVHSASPSVFEEAIARNDKTNLTLADSRVGKVKQAKRNASAPIILKADNIPYTQNKSEVSEKSNTIPVHDVRRNLNDSLELKSASKRSQKLKGPIAERYDMSSAFDKQTDPILRFLSSRDNDMVLEGVSLLKFAIMGEEDLSGQVNLLLRNISIKHPEFLRPLIFGNEKLVEKLKQFFLTIDFLRVYFILSSQMEKENVNLIIALFDVDDIYTSVTKLASFVANINNVTDGNDLTMQIIRFKSVLIRLIIEFLLLALDRIPISDNNFLKLIAHLFELVGIVKSTSIYDSFCKLLIKLHSINHTLFNSELQMSNSSTKEEVEYVVGIDDVLDLKTNNTIQFGTLFELTKVIPGANLDQLSPLKATSDLTMVVPASLNESVGLALNPEDKKKSENAKTVEDSSEYKDKDEQYEMSLSSKFLEQDFDVDGEESMDMDKAGMESLCQEGNENAMHIEDDNDAVRSSKDGEVKLELEYLYEREASVSKSMSVDKLQDHDNLSLRFPLMKETPKNDNSSELAENLAQVQLSDAKLDSMPLQALIEKVDPLNKMSHKNKPIHIFEDRSGGSPQRVKEYDYAERNWFNFQLAKYALHADFEDGSIASFKHACAALVDRTIVGEQFVLLFNHLQIDSKDLSFSSYFLSDGKALLENSLWAFFSDPSLLNTSQKLSGLIILKQFLINGSSVDLSYLWNILCALSLELQGCNCELAHALNETFEEALSGLFRSEKILLLVLESVREITTEEENTYKVIFILECLLKIVDSNSFDLIVNETLVLRIHDLIFKYINWQAVEVRRLAISCYGRMLRSLNGALQFERQDQKQSACPMERIFKTLTIPQRKLIEYYSQL